MGSTLEPLSGLGIIAGFGNQLLGIAATTVQGDTRHRTIGCVVGSVLNRETIDGYGLTPFSARDGDALLAFIGIVPSAQGSRLRCRDPSTYELMEKSGGAQGHSLARLLFDSWLSMPVVRRCPSVFIRTRRRIGAVRHLSEAAGFEFYGSFDIDFRSELQERLVYRKANGRSDFKTTRGTEGNQAALKSK